MRTGLQRCTVLALVAGIALGWGEPRPSDVTMRSLSWHQGGPHDTFAAASAWNVTRLDWVYTTNITFFAEAHARHLKVSAAMNAELPDIPDVHPPTFNVGRQVDVHNRQITLPWMTWGAVPGCANHPGYRAIALAAAVRLADAGADGIQHDDSRINHNGHQYGGCFCAHCVARFTPWLLMDRTENPDALAPADAVRWNISTAFNYSAFVLSLAPPTTPTPAPQPVPPQNGTKAQVLAAKWAAFHDHSDRSYFDALRAGLAAHTNRTNRTLLPLSGNNGGRWDDARAPWDRLDFNIGEFGLDSLCGVTSTPSSAVSDLALWAGGGACVEAVIGAGRVFWNRTQILTMPKFNPDQLDASSGAAGAALLVRLTRAATATSYALGSPMLVPFDIYMPGFLYEPAFPPVPPSHPAATAPRFMLPTDARAAAADVTGALTTEPSLVACGHACNRRATCKGVRWLAAGALPNVSRHPGTSARCWTLRAPLYLVHGTAINGTSEQRVIAHNGSLSRSFETVGTGAAGDGARFLLPSDTTAAAHNVTGIQHESVTHDGCEALCVADGSCAALWLSPALPEAPCWSLDKLLPVNSSSSGGGGVGGRGKDEDDDDDDDDDIGMSLLRTANPRYFGNVSEYGDIFAFVRRRGAALLDGAQNGSSTLSPGDSLPVRVPPAAQGMPRPYVALRMLPPPPVAATSTARVRQQRCWAVHVVLWPGTACSSPCAVELQRDFFFAVSQGGGVNATLDALGMDAIPQLAPSATAEAGWLQYVLPPSALDNDNGWVVLSFCA